MKRLTVVLAVLALTPLSACASFKAGEAAGEAGGARTATCRDATGDGGNADIVSVKLAEQADGLHATWNLAAPPNTSSGTLLLSLVAWSEDGKAGRQLGAKWTDGKLSVFSADLVQPQNRYLDVEPKVAGKTVSLTFPHVIEDLGQTWRWTATTNVDGADVDSCPEPGADSLNPHRQPFPDV